MISNYAENVITISKGRMRIFFGAAPGVGKTYSMLESAHSLKRNGVDVVIGLIETHGRSDTAKLKEGLEELPKEKRIYRGRIFEEMDLDAVLERKPKLVLVDELAHTNIPGGRHSKRYMDVEEILNSGIDVFTTLNVQHVESLHTIVREITGVSVRETVPDGLISLAESVELIDIPSEDVLQRLKEGKIYLAQQALLAEEKFFAQSSLVALRELTLRYTAQRIEKDVCTFAVRTNRPELKEIGQERILVCIDEASESAELIRMARRTASFRENVIWSVLYVDTDENDDLTNQQKQQIADNLSLAKDLGGEVHTLQGTNIVDDIIDFVETQHIDEIIVGKKRKSKNWKSGIAKKLVTKANVSVKAVPIGTKKQHSFTKLFNINLARSIDRVVFTALLVIAGHIIALGASHYLKISEISAIYLFTLIPIASFSGIVLTSIAAVVLGLLHNITFLEGIIHGRLTSLEGLITLAIFLGSAFVLSYFAPIEKRKRGLVGHYWLFAGKLYAFSKDIKEIKTLTLLFDHLAEGIYSLTNIDCAIYSGVGKERVSRITSKGSDFQVTRLDREAIEWTISNAKQSGIGTETFSEVKLAILPLIGVNKGEGAIILKTKEPIDSFQHKLIDILIYQTMSAFDRVSIS